MTKLTTQIMDIGGLLLRMVWIVVSQVLFILLAGLIAVILYAVVCYLVIVDSAYRRSLFGSGSDKPKR
jgi:membrane protein YdbS with pleckstrin-like domain